MKKRVGVKKKEKIGKNDGSHDEYVKNDGGQCGYSYCRKYRHRSGPDSPI